MSLGRCFGKFVKVVKIWCGWNQIVITGDQGQWARMIGDQLGDGIGV